MDPTTQECRVDHRPCPTYTGFDQIGASLHEEPRYEADYESGQYERLLRVTGPRVVGPLGTSETHWQMDFDVESDRPSKGQLAFGGPRPLGVLSLPTPVRYRWNHKVLDCPVDYGEGRNEPVLLSQNSLRDASGILLVASGHAPLMSGGATMLAAGNVPELAIAWKDAGCGACPHPYARQRVALEFTVTETGKRATLMPGEDAMAEMSGSAYVLSNRGTVRPRPNSPAFCGFAFWSIYRAGIYIKLNADGSAAVP